MEPQRGQMDDESVMPYYPIDRRHRLGNRGEFANDVIIYFSNPAAVAIAVSAPTSPPKTG